MLFHWVLVKKETQHRLRWLTALLRLCGYLITGSRINSYFPMSCQDLFCVELCSRVVEIDTR